MNENLEDSNKLLENKLANLSKNKDENKKIVFGQLLIGPPGSGKSSFCKGMYDFMKKLGRNVFVINLDPGNDVVLPYDASIDICELITVNDVMENFKLGPNGALIQCMEFLESNSDWLINKINELVKSLNNPYILIDSPGQVELFIHNNSLKNLIDKLTKKSCMFDLRLVCVNLVDSFYANDPGKYISALFTSLNSMLHFELPHVNILSKLDLMEKHKPTNFNLEYYCEVLDLNYLLETIDNDKFFEKYKKLSKALIDIIESYNLVQFIPVNINDNKTILNALNHIDRANGFFLIRIETEQHKLRFDLDFNELYTGN